MAIPGRQIDAKLQAILPAGIRHFLNKVSSAIPPWAALHTVVCIFAWPETKAIMMLAGKDQASHTCRLKRSYPLLGVELGRVEEAWAFIAQTPFPDL